MRRKGEVNGPGSTRNGGPRANTRQREGVRGMTANCIDISYLDVMQETNEIKSFCRIPDSSDCAKPNILFLKAVKIL